MVHPKPGRGFTKNTDPAILCLIGGLLCISYVLYRILSCTFRPEQPEHAEHELPHLDLGAEKIRPKSSLKAAETQTIGEFDFFILLHVFFLEGVGVSADGERYTLFGQNDTGFLPDEHLPARFAEYESEFQDKQTHTTISTKKHGIPSALP